MQFQGLGLLFLQFLTVARIPCPGVSQYAGGLKTCQDCSKTVDKKLSDSFSMILVTRRKYKDCANNIVRFELPRGILCFYKQWVQHVIDCIDKGETHCLGSSGSEAQKDTVKGSNEKPPTNPPTTSASNTDVPTQPGKEGTRQPTEATKPDPQTTVKRGHNTASSSDSNPNNNDQLQGSNEKPPTDPPTTSTANTDVPTQPGKEGTRQPTEATKPDPQTTVKRGHNTASSSDSNPNNNDQLQGSGPSGNKDESQVKDLKPIVISLIGIILVMVTGGTAYWCRKKKAECQMPWREPYALYTVASSEDSIEK